MLSKRFSHQTKEITALHFLKQKLMHFSIVFISVIVIISNITHDSKAGVISDKMHKTIMANIVSSEFGEIEYEELIEESFDGISSFVPVEQKYLTDLNAVESIVNIGTREVKRVEDETMLDALGITLDGEALIKPEISTITKITQPRSGIEEYIVQSGDSVSTIARKFGISVNTILWENNLSARSLIRPGNELTILPTTGIMHKVVSGDNLSKIANKYDVDTGKITKANSIGVNSNLRIGQKLMVPNGTKTATYTPARTSYSGISAIKNIVKQPNAQPVSNKMNWPTVGHRITQYYSWRHKGLDIANKTGTPLYAADAGTVTWSAWSTGYGYNVVIDHGGGKKTRYAHNSKLFVSKGDIVSKGETIAAMGSTGWSTGPHVHFEVIINNVKYNPLNYIQ